MKTRFLSRMLFALLWLWIAGVNAAIAQQNAIPAQPHIVVYGDAEAKVVPDRFKIRIELQALSLNANEARQQVATLFDKTLKQLIDRGVNPLDIVAENLSISAEYGYHNNTQNYNGSRVRRTIDALFHSNDLLEAFLADTETSENLTISGVQTTFSDIDSLKRELRKESIKTTRQKAEVLANEYSMKIKSLYSVSDVPPKFEYGIRPGNWPTSKDWEYSTQSGLLERISTTGSKIDSTQLERFNTGYITYQDRIYAIFLIEENEN